MLTYVQCLPQERRRRAAKLGAPPSCGPLISPRNPKKLWSQWLRRRVGTKARNRVARRIKIPKRRVSAVGGACSKMARSQWLSVLTWFDIPIFSSSCSRACQSGSRQGLILRAEDSWEWQPGLDCRRDHAEEERGVLSQAHGGAYWKTQVRESAFMNVKRHIVQINAFRTGVFWFT